MKDATARTIYRQEYSPPDFLVETVELTFAVDRDRTEINSRLHVRRNPDGAGHADLVLDGDGLETQWVRVDGEPVADDDLEIGASALRLRGLPRAAVIETCVVISPAKNTALEGLYASGPFLLTQCEPEGFRRITWMIDRPDVMARYRVRIEGDRERFPVLLSNGNQVDAGELADGRHFATWDDPFPKPSYLFALVAGALECLEDTFETVDGRKVALRFFAEPENMGRLDYAMDSLKRAMRWDEERFGLAYDLDIYNVVATNDFNMGAMENKSLNIFNSKYVLALPETATDQDYQGIEGVIAHEYFHNWTGNRVTCRDWFQLSLKEGLTVFRDQEFSSDEQSRAVKRIEDVRMLRTLQFAEDAGPMAHPVRPESYMEINNFYTLTVYEKGAEVVRMYHTLLGEEGFQRGMRLYFERHDGHAVTCDDFRRAMADANDVDLEQFGRWYAQAGTPEVNVVDDFDEAAGRYTLTISQRTPEAAGSDERRPLHVPIALGLLASDGSELPLRCVNGELGGDGDVIELTGAEERFAFEGLTERPVPSLLRRFSAPVKLSFGYDRDQLAFLMAHDSDPFNRWDAGQRLATDVLLELAGRGAGSPADVDARLTEAACQVLGDRQADPALIAEALQLPSLEYLAQQGDVMRIESLHGARNAVNEAIAAAGLPLIRQRHDELVVAGPYRPVAADIGQRSLRNRLLGLLATVDRSAAASLAGDQYEQADNMTDRLAALRVLVHEALPGADEALEAFAAEFGSDPLTMDKWFAVQASRPSVDTLTEVRSLLEHPAFSLRNPNKVRSVLGVFGRNLVAFHAPGGAGYRFLAEQVLALDALNPQIAARLGSAFNQWRRLPDAAGAEARSALVTLRDAGPLSPDLNEIVTKALSGGSGDA